MFSPIGFKVIQNAYSQVTSIRIQIVTDIRNQQLKLRGDSILRTKAGTCQKASEPPTIATGRVLGRLIL